jgi:two-component system, cell cycle sensor histidine kinase and response regulator CckA
MPENYHVLVVDDDDEHAEWIAEFLRISGPFTSDRAKDVAELWTQLYNHSYDTILLDYKLPDGTGLDALVEMQNRGYLVPVIIVTGQGDERIAVKAMHLGAADYMIKGAESLLTLPAIIQKAIQAYQLKLSVQRSLEQIRYQALLLNNVRDAVVVWDTNGKITYWNPAAEMLYGWKSSERLNQPVASNYHNLFAPAVREPPREGTAGQEIERRYVTPEHQLIWVSSRVSILRDYESGRLLGYMDVTRDITSRKKVEHELRIAQMRIAQTARLAAVGELAAGVAHHINNPLTSIIGESHLLLQNLPEDHPAHESAEIIKKAGWRVQQAVQQLLELSRPAVDTLVNLDVNQTIRDALNLIGDPIRMGGVNLEVLLGENLPDIYGNTRQLSDLWVNLLLLARDATSDGSAHTIRIRSIKHNTKTIQVEIFDDGTPIPAEVVPHLFEPDFHKPIKQRGTGIEFSICSEIVQQHHGQISAESDPQHGTILRVILGGAS